MCSALEGCRGCVQRRPTLAGLQLPDMNGALLHTSRPAHGGMPYRKFIFWQIRPGGLAAFRVQALGEQTLAGLQAPDMSGELPPTSWPAELGMPHRKRQLRRSGRAGWRRSRWRCQARAEPWRRRWRSLWRCRAARARPTRTCRHWRRTSGRRCAAQRPRRCVRGTWALGATRTLESAAPGAEAVVGCVISVKNACFAPTGKMVLSVAILPCHMHVLLCSSRCRARCAMPAMIGPACMEPCLQTETAVEQWEGADSI